MKYHSLFQIPIKPSTWSNSSDTAQDTHTSHNRVPAFNPGSAPSASFLRMLMEEEHGLPQAIWSLPNMQEMEIGSLALSFVPIQSRIL